MSQRWERVEEALPATLPRAVNRLAVLYHIPVLFALLAFMLWTRTRHWGRYVNGGQVLYNGNDAWYHLREVRYVVRNWPSTMPFDPWTGFPVGHASGQFGTIYDQLVATAALVVGLGSPSDQTVALTLLFAPAVLGTLTAIPVYVMGERLGGRPGGLVAVLILALSPGAFLRRSLVGFADHHVAEVFFLTIAVAVTMMAVSVGERERPIYELVAAREWEALRLPASWGALAGLAITLYIWAWPPGVLLLVVLGAFFAVKLSLDYLRGTSPDHVGFIAVIAMAVTAVLTLLTIDAIAIETTVLSLLQPGFALAVGLGAVLMAGLARVWDGQSLPRRAYPAAVAAIGLVLVGILAIALPTLFDFFIGQALRVFGHAATAQSRTVGEAQPIPLDQAIPTLYRSFGMALFVGLIAVAAAAWQLADDEANRGELLLIVILAIFMTAATLTQQRFSYYLVVPLAVLNGYLLGNALNLAELEAITHVRDIQAYQVLAVLTVIILIVGPFVAFSSGGPSSDPSLTALQVSDQSFPGEVTQWQGSLHWLANRTPEEGQYARPEDESMAYYGQYEPTADFDYPAGSYGVMSWWDYGHFITVEGKRIPYANPFQQHARGAAVYLLEPNETNANRMLVSEDGERTRYVMIDWKLDYARSGKFSAPLVFYDTTGYQTEAGPSIRRSDIIRFAIDQQSNQLAFVFNTQRHYESMRTRLYKFHGSAIEPEPVVIDYEPTGSDAVVLTPSGPNATAFRQFPTMSAARQFVEQDGSAQIGGFGRFPSERVPALEHYRLVHASDSSAFRSQRFRSLMVQNLRGMGLCRGANRCLQLGARIQPTPPRWVKTFERVPGATVVGEGPANETVTASATFQMPGSNETFVYHQRARTDADGQFRMTLPYSTTGYDNWGPQDGYTNVSVRASGPYTFATIPRQDDNLTTTQWRATAHVSEGKVIGADEEPVSVTMEERTLDRPEGATGDDGSGSNGNTSSSETTDNTSSTGGTGSNDSETTASMQGPWARSARG